MEISGKVIAVLDIEKGTSKSGNAWEKRNFVIETEGLYSKKICFQLFGDKVKECPAVGEAVKVSFDIDSHEWNSRWFTQLNAWRVDRESAQQNAVPSQPSVAQQAKAEQEGVADDLPF